MIGALGLMALGFLIQVGLRMNYQQELEQQTFRQALLFAKCEGDSGDDKRAEPRSRCRTLPLSVDGQEESQATQYTQLRDRQVADPSQGFAILPRTTTQASAAVTWGEFLTFLADDRDSQPRTILDVNRRRRDFRTDDLKGTDPHAPLVTRVTKHLTSTGNIVQARRRTDTRTRLHGRTTEQTTVVLKNKERIQSTVASHVDLDWRSH